MCESKKEDESGDVFCEARDYNIGIHVSVSQDMMNMGKSAEHEAYNYTCECVWV